MYDKFKKLSIFEVEFLNLEQNTLVDEKAFQ
jgi:hypothetical protein